MSVTVVLDGAGLHAWAERRPERQVLTVMEVLRRAGAGRVLVPSVVTVEALTGDSRDAAVNQILEQIEVQEHLPLSHAHAAVALRQGTDGSAVDAVVAEAALRTRAAYVITCDADNLNTLIDRGAGRTAVVTVEA